MSGLGDGSMRGLGDGSVGGIGQQVGLGDG